MQFVLRLCEWHRQCVQVGKEFWVFPVGMFGSKNAGDFAENFTTLVTDICREILGMPNVNVYVDNFDNAVPPLEPGIPDWERARIEWRSMLQLTKMLGIPTHEHMEPTVAWGYTDPLGKVVDGHLGWGGETLPTPKIWVPVKRRTKIKGLAERWASQTKFGCSQIASIVGVFQSLQTGLKFLGKFLASLIAWQTRCEQRVRLQLVRDRKAEVFPNKNVSRVLQGMVSMLEHREWSVPLIDWHSPLANQIVYVYADAATPKKLGTSYNSKVWGKAAYTSFQVDGVQRHIALMSKHKVESIQAAKRVAALSSAILELENYVQAIIKVAKISKAKIVCIVGDCEVALKWIDLCVPKDPDAARLLAILIENQMDHKFTTRTLWKSNTDETIKIADRLSKGDDVLLQAMLQAGYALEQYEPIRWWPGGSKSS